MPLVGNIQIVPKGPFWWNRPIELIRKIALYFCAVEGAWLKCICSSQTEQMVLYCLGALNYLLCAITATEIMYSNF